MRLGIVLDGSRPAAASEQRDLLAARDCEVIAHESRMTPQVRRRLDRLIRNLHRGDELVLADLAALERTTGELAQLLRNLFQVGVAVRLARAEGDDVLLAPDDSSVALVLALSEHEGRRTPVERAYRRRRSEVGRPLELTKHQIEYARKLYADGASPRSIGLIFQATPDQIWQLIGR